MAGETRRWFDVCLEQHEAGDTGDQGCAAREARRGLVPYGAYGVRSAIQGAPDTRKTRIQGSPKGSMVPSEEGRGRDRVPGWG